MNHLEKNEIRKQSFKQKARSSESIQVKLGYYSAFIMTSIIAGIGSIMAWATAVLNV